MKRIISLIAITTVALSTVSGSFAQQRIKHDISNLETEFGTIVATTSGDGVLLEWEMKREKANVGFKVYRIAKGRQIEATKNLISGSFATAGRFPLAGQHYSFFDCDGNRSARYIIEATDLGGKTVVSSPVSTSDTPKLKRKDQPLCNSDLEVPGTNALVSEEVNPPAELSTAVGPILPGSPPIPSESGTEPDPITHQWVLSHAGVKISVKKEGIFRVPTTQLQTAGFNTASDPANWQLYLNGVEQAITIDPGVSYIEFYGKGVDTAESDTQGYFLIVGNEAGKRIQNTIVSPTIGTGVLKSYDQTFMKKERTQYNNGILNGPAENYFGSTIVSSVPSGANINFDLRGIDFTDTESTLDLKIQGVSDSSHLIQITLNNQVLSNLGGGISQFPFQGSQAIPTSLLRDASLNQGQNVLNLKAIGPGFDSDMFDTVSIRFNRKHLAFQNVLKAYAVKSKSTKLTGFTSATTRVFDISNPDTPRLITNIPFQQQGSTYETTIPAGRGMLFYAIENSAIQAPVSVTPTDGQLLVNNPAPDLIIISHKDFMTQAQAWASYRTNQGVDVLVANVEDVFDEFNYGVLSNDSIETFLNYAHTNWQTDYVLLIGDATDDPRRYRTDIITGLPLPFGNYVPTRFVPTIFTETGSDESLADFNDDGLAEMAVGRIPARLPGSVTNALAKVTNWETNLLSNPLGRGALFAYDLPDGFDFQGMSEGLRDQLQLPVGVTATMVSRGEPNANSNLLAAMNTGKYIINYSGHGAAVTWGESGFFSGIHLPSLTNHNNESIYTMLTCLNGAFPSLTIPSLAERLVDHTNGGAVAAWASTGLTTPDVQEVMAQRFYDQVDQGNIVRLGDLISDAKSVLVGGTDVRLSWALIGDPMLKVR